MGTAAAQAVEWTRHDHCGRYTSRAGERAAPRLIQSPAVAATPAHTRGTAKWPGPARAAARESIGLPDFAIGVPRGERRHASARGCNARSNTEDRMAARAGKSKGPTALADLFATLAFSIMTGALSALAFVIAAHGDKA